MKVDVDFEQSQTVPVPLAKGLALFDDLEANIRLFPKLAKLTPLGPLSHLWQLEPLGTAGISHTVTFGMLYEIDRDAGVVRWKPVPGKGNAVLRGEWALRAQGDSTRITLRVSGTLDELAIPFALRPLAGAFVKAQFKALLERYMEKTLRSVQ